MREGCKQLHILRILSVNYRGKTQQRIQKNTDKCSSIDFHQRYQNQLKENQYLLNNSTPIQGVYIYISCQEQRIFFHIINNVNLRHTINLRGKTKTTKFLCKIFNKIKLKAIQLEKYFQHMYPRKVLPNRIYRRLN